MKYHYKKPASWVQAGRDYHCKHRFYRMCTLFSSGLLDDYKGLAVVQEHYDYVTKERWWGYVKPWIAGDIFTNERFPEYFASHARAPDKNGLYPTVKLRSLMWALRMKPLKKEPWEEWDQLSLEKWD